MFSQLNNLTMLDATLVSVVGFIALMFYQIVMTDRQSKRYADAMEKNAEAIDNSTKAIVALRELMVYMNKSDGLHEKLLTSILERIDRN